MLGASCSGTQRYKTVFFSYVDDSGAGGILCFLLQVAHCALAVFLTTWVSPSSLHMAARVIVRRVWQPCAWKHGSTPRLCCSRLTFWPPAALPPSQPLSLVQRLHWTTNLLPWQWNRMKVRRVSETPPAISKWTQHPKETNQRIYPTTALLQISGSLLGEDLAAILYYILPSFLLAFFGHDFSMSSSWWISSGSL